MNHPASQPAPVIRTDDFLLPSDTAGIALHVRRKRPADVEDFPAEQTVLLMHGATFPSASLFDVPLAGRSFMDDLAARGFDVYALDVRGYGGSTRPAEMEDPPEAAEPLVRTETAVRDLAGAVEHIRRRRCLDKLNLVAMSWGGSVAGAYTARHHDRVAKLALIAPQWLAHGFVRIDPGGALGAYRRIAVRETKGSWLAAAPAGPRDGRHPPGGVVLRAAPPQAAAPPAPPRVV